MSSATSQLSTETRVPGVSDTSIASSTRAASVMSSAVSKYCRTTAVPCSTSVRIWSRLAATPGGGPSDSLIPGPNFVDPVRAYVGEPDDSHVHDQTSRLACEDDNDRHVAGGKFVG